MFRFRFLLFCGLMLQMGRSQSHLEPLPKLDAKVAERFANLALACVERAYPTKIAHVLNSEKDVQPPRALTPAFYGCYDWHSAVHGHWMLARLARLYPGEAFATRAKEALNRNLTAQNLKVEADYLAGPGRQNFERPYGLAWLLQLTSELREWHAAEPEAAEVATWSAALAPPEAVSVVRMRDWLSKLPHPVRSGEHSNTAFGLGLSLDYARSIGNHELSSFLEQQVRRFYFADTGCPISYEPSGEDFLSPCLAEADLMRRVLQGPEFATWLRSFLPAIPQNGALWLKPEVVTDPTDGKIAHLDGLNLSRAWMMNGIASSLPPGDARIASLRATANLLGRDGLRAVTGDHYEGGHWLGSFAVYLLSERGVRN